MKIFYHVFDSWSYLCKDSFGLSFSVGSLFRQFGKEFSIGCHFHDQMDPANRLTHLEQPTIEKLF